MIVEANGGAIQNPNAQIKNVLKRVKI